MIRNIKKGDIIGPIAHEYDLNFQVIDINDEGGMGIVYIGLLKKYGFIIALKTFKDDYIKFKGAIDNFKKESLAWINLEYHPNIVNALLFDVINDRPFISIEYIVPDSRHRNTLEHYLNSDLSTEQILDWGIQFCYGMSHAFNRGISPHRDIKPANIMITEDKILKITDFGLAKIWDNKKLAYKDSYNELTLVKNDDGTVMSGTYQWMAPETFSGQADIRSDIYSFGVVLYQMINNGTLPFKAENPDEWKNAHQNHEIPPHSDSIIFPVIKKCLDKKPENRYNDFNEIKKDLEEIYTKETGKNPYKPLDIIKQSKGIRMGKAHSYEKLGFVDDALRMYEDLANMESDCYIDDINLGSAFNRFEKPEKAIYHYKKALEINPNDFLAHYNLGNAFSNNGQIEDASNEYKESIRLKPDFKECRVNYGNLLRDLGKNDKAIEHYNIALQLDPSFFKAKLNLGLALGNKKEFNKAIKVFQDAEKISQKSIDLYIVWAIMLSKIGDIEGALLKHIKALSIDPKNSEAHFFMGVFHLNRGNPENAINEFREAIESEPENYLAYSELAFSLQHIGNLDESIDCYDKSIKINPNYELSWLQKGLTLAKLDRYDDAIACLDEALKINPKSAVGWLNKGNVFGNLGKYEEAIKCYNNVLKIDQRCEKAWFHKGMTYFNLNRDNNDLHKALSCFEEALKIKPEFYQAYHFQSMIWGLLDNPEKALKSIEKALEKNQENVDYLCVKAIALLSLNRRNEASECLEKAQNIDPNHEFFSDSIA